MFYDLKADRSVPAELHADVAVIGAGAAGLTLTRRLLDRGLKVILLESGGTDYERASADLNAGANVGQDYYALDHARLRFFGGTTAIWGGRCAELDPIDFAVRSWVPDSGWPFGVDVMRPYYAEAWKALDVTATRDDPAQAARAIGFDSDRLSAPRWLFDTRADRFAKQRDLARRRGCTIVTHATVREIVAADDGNTIDRLDVVSLNGRALKVKARSYVLAAGGIENPRLLLASRSVLPEGLGNRHDQVGRYFMEHPHARGGRIVGGAAWRLLSAFQRKRVNGLDQARLLTPSPRAQAELGLLNTSLSIQPRRPAAAKEALLMRAYNHARHSADPTAGGRMAWRALKKGVGALQRYADPTRAWLMHNAGALDLSLLVRAEQAPNANSRVMLGSDLDAIGMPRVALDWRTSALDVHSVAGLVDLIGQNLAAAGMGRVEAAKWLADAKDGNWVTDPLVSSHAIGGFHHMGTTRMSDDPRRGVADASGRVHGLANLYVAGSSLFPTSGWANPTLTIVALAMRTGDVIARQLTEKRVQGAADPVGDKIELAA